MSPTRVVGPLKGCDWMPDSPPPGWVSIGSFSLLPNIPPGSEVEQPASTAPISTSGSAIMRARAILSRRAAL